MNHPTKLRLLSSALALILSLICCSSTVVAAAESDENPQDVTTEATDAANTAEPDVLPVFPDVFEQDWFYSDVTRLAAMKVLNGYPDGYFYPDRDITNADNRNIELLALEDTHIEEKVPESHSHFVETSCYFFQ